MRPDNGPAPLAFPQARLWFMEQLAPGEPTYNAAIAMWLRGPLYADPLKQAIATVIERHEALRTNFAELDGGPRQIAADDWSFDLPVVDMRDVPAEGRERDALRLAREEARRPFDLRCDLMLRATLYRTGDEEHLLLFVEHHIAFDGWSDGELFSEIEEQYEASRSGREAVLPDLPVQYADFAVWQAERMRGERLERHVAYWRRTLAGAPAGINLPLDRPRPPVQRFSGRHRYVTLPSALAQQVTALSRTLGVTPYMTLLACFNALLHRWTGDDDILVGSPIANRDRVELEHLIGFFSNTLVFRTRLGGDPTFRELVRRTRDVALTAYEHQDLPFEKIVEAIRPPRDASRNPIFQVNFRVQTSPPTKLQLPQLEAELAEVDVGFARFDLALELQFHGDGLRGYVEYNDALFEPATIDRLADHLEALFTDALGRPDARISSLALAPDASAAARRRSPIRGARKQSPQSA